MFKRLILFIIIIIVNKMSNKTIHVDPALFSVGKFNKTKKNREKKEKPIIKPLISPNILKNRLLKKIKDHKQREIKNQR